MKKLSGRTDKLLKSLEYKIKIEFVYGFISLENYMKALQKNELLHV